MKKISVLMGVYNCESTLAEAVGSIVSQTYPEWELIICDDGSNDGTLAKAKEFAAAEPRIKVLENGRNLGLSKTLNRCFGESTGEYIARMDGDDRCDSERFEKQAAFLDSTDEYAIVSSSMKLFDENGEWGIIEKPEYPTARDTVEGSPICHAPVMMRRECLEAVGGYSENDRVLRVEDVDLWIRLYAAGFKCRNLREPLYSMRNDKNALNRRKYRYRINSASVRLKGCKRLGLGMKSRARALRPMIYGLVPARLRDFLRRRKRSDRD